MADLETMSSTQLARRAIGRGKTATKKGKLLTAYRIRARVAIVALSVAKGVQAVAEETGVSTDVLHRWRYNVRYGAYPASAELRAAISKTATSAAKPISKPAKAQATPTLDKIMDAAQAESDRTGEASASIRGMCYEFTSATGTVRLPLTADADLVRHAIDRVLGAS